MSRRLESLLAHCGDTQRLADLARTDEAMREAEKAAEPLEEVDPVDALRCAGVI